MINKPMNWTDTIEIDEPETAPDAQKRDSGGLSAENDKLTIETDTGAKMANKSASEGTEGGEPFGKNHEKILAAALWYARHNIAVLPVDPNTKHPRNDGGGNGASKDPETIKRWWSEMPDSNVAIAAGMNGLVIIDADRGHKPGVDGIEQLRDWQEQNGFLPDTWTDTSPRGGQHFYFRTSESFANIQNNQPPELSGVDLRGTGGYCVAPPSVSKDGVYQWDLAPNEQELASNDSLLRKLATDLKPQREPGTSFETPETIPEGARNGTLTSIAGKLRRDGLNESEMAAALQVINNNRCEPPLDEKEVARIAKSISRPKLDGGEIEIIEPPQTQDEILDRFIDDIYTDKYKAIPTGIRALDERLKGGFLAQTLILLSSEPGGGKTSIATQIFEDLARRDYPVIYYNLEMSVQQMIARSVSRICYKRNPTHKLDAIDILRAGQLSETSQRIIDAGVQEYRETIAKNLEYRDAGNNAANVSNILQDIDKAGQMAQENGQQAPLIVLDYLHLLQPNRGEDMTESLKRAVLGFKQYAIKYNSLAFCIMAQSRQENKSNTASMGAGRDTGSLEYTSDISLQLKPNDTGQNRQTKLYITKNRYGKASTRQHLVFEFMGGQSYLKYIKDDTDPEKSGGSGKKQKPQARAAGKSKGKITTIDGNIPCK